MHLQGHHESNLKYRKQLKHSDFRFQPAKLLRSLQEQRSEAPVTVCKMKTRKVPHHPSLFSYCITQFALTTFSACMAHSAAEDRSSTRGSVKRPAHLPDVQY